MTLEANAAMKSIVRRETGEDWNTYVTRLMREDGTLEPDEEPTAEDLRRYDKQRKNKRVSNDDWQSPSDPDSRITKLKDGRTHLAYKAEHTVDLDSEIVVAAEVYAGDSADTDTLPDSLLQAQVNLNEAESDVRIEEAAADKGYHAARTLEMCQSMGVRTYVPEPRRVHRSRWTDKPEEHRKAVLANRRRTKRAKSKHLQRLRSERVERSFAHVCDSGGARRTWLRGLENVSKHYLIRVAAHNLGRILRMLFGIGKPKAMRGLLASAGLSNFSAACSGLPPINKRNDSAQSRQPTPSSTNSPSSAKTSLDQRNARPSGRSQTASGSFLSGGFVIACAH